MKLTFTLLLALTLLNCTNQPVQQNLQTIGGGTIDQFAKGPAPSFHYGDDTIGYVLVKNWDFGKNGTIQTMEDMSNHFQYHD